MAISNANPRSLAGNHNPWLIAIVVSIATFMEVLDTAIANVSLKHIAGSLSAGLDESTWVLTSYLVANAIILPISGWLADLIGRKRFYMICVAVFTLSSLLCGLAPNLPLLIFFRVLQGAGGGGLAPSEQSILADTFPPHQRGMAFAIYGVAVVFAPAIGPTLGGYITDNYSWHWIFLINVPAGIASLLLVYFLLHEPQSEKQERQDRRKKGFHIDYIGFALIAVGLGFLQIVLDKGQEKDWFGTPYIVAFTALSLIALLFFIPWELSQKEPIVDLRLFSVGGFAAACALMFSLGFILFGSTQILPEMSQALYGYTATLAGLVITPGGFAVMVMMPLVGFLINKTQPRYLIALGMFIEFLACYHLSNLSLDASYSTLAFARIYQAAGIAFLFIPITTASYAGIPPAKTNQASAMLNLMRNLGGSFGISLAQTQIARRSQFHQTRLISHMVPTNPLYHQTLAQITATLRAHGQSAADAASRASALLAQSLSIQVQTLSYLDVFRTMAWASLAAIPLVFLLKKTKPGQAAAH